MNEPEIKLKKFSSIFCYETVLSLPDCWSASGLQGAASLTVTAKSSGRRHFFLVTLYVIIIVIKKTKWWNFVTDGLKSLMTPPLGGLVSGQLVDVFFCLLVVLPVHWCVGKLIHLSVGLFFCFSVCLFDGQLAGLSIPLSVCLLNGIPVGWCFCLPVCWSFFLSDGVLVGRSVCLPVCWLVSVSGSWSVLCFVCMLARWKVF